MDLAGLLVDQEVLLAFHSQNHRQNKFHKQVTIVSPTSIFDSSIPKKSRASCCNWQNCKKCLGNTILLLMAMTTLELSLQYWQGWISLDQHFNLDVFRNRELTWYGALVWFRWSVNNDLLCRGHIGCDQDACIHLIFNVHFTGLLCWID